MRRRGGGRGRRGGRGPSCCRGRGRGCPRAGASRGGRRARCGCPRASPGPRRPPCTRWRSRPGSTAPTSTGTAAGPRCPTAAMPTSLSPPLSTSTSLPTLMVTLPLVIFRMLKPTVGIMSSVNCPLCTPALLLPRDRDRSRRRASLTAMTLTKVVFPLFWSPTRVSSISSFQKRLRIQSNTRLIMFIIAATGDSLPYCSNARPAIDLMKLLLPIWVETAIEARKRCRLDEAELLNEGRGRAGRGEEERRGGQGFVPWASVRPTPCEPIQASQRWPSSPCSSLAPLLNIHPAPFLSSRLTVRDNETI